MWGVEPDSFAVFFASPKKKWFHAAMELWHHLKKKKGNAVYYLITVEVKHVYRMKEKGN